MEYSGFPSFSSGAFYGKAYDIDIIKENIYGEFDFDVSDCGYNKVAGRKTRNLCLREYYLIEAMG